MTAVALMMDQTHQSFSRQNREKSRKKPEQLKIVKVTTYRQKCPKKLGTLMTATPEIILKEKKRLLKRKYRSRKMRHKQKRMCLQNLTAVNHLKIRIIISKRQNFQLNPSNR